MQETPSTEKNFETTESVKEKISRKQTVDINILLNKLRSEQKKEKVESYVLLGMISVLVLVTGIIVSL